ncbi:hypothetical protein [Chitiniphilus eburneus]|uniref:hypothetical protein n=1 Tax=Chitiniphilus eburneus TaxID=2571148 RepID=UPI0035CE8777
MALCVELARAQSGGQGAALFADSGVAGYMLREPSTPAQCTGYLITPDELEIVRFLGSSGFDPGMFAFGFTAILVFFAIGLGAGMGVNMIRKLR